MKGERVTRQERFTDPLTLGDNGVGKDLDTKDPDFLKKFAEEAGFEVEER